MKFSTSLGLIYISIVFFVCGSCELLGGKDDKIASELIPLEVGNYWDYHRWYLSPNIADTIREEITGKYDFIIDGISQSAYGYHQLYPGGSTQNKIPAMLADRGNTITSSIYKLEAVDPEYQWLRANVEEGLVSIGGISPTDTLILKAMHYKYPGKAGDETEYPTLSYSFQDLEFSVQDTITIETIGTNETFESEWATYKGCYLYRFTETSKDPVYIWDHYVYIKPGMGVVAVDTRQHYSGGEDPEDETIGQWVLINYQFN